jgi:HK97 family phage major capsid protein
MQDRVRPEFLSSKGLFNMSQLRENMQEFKAIRSEMAALRARAASENRDMRPDENATYNAKAGRAVTLEEAIAEQEGKQRAPGTLFHAVNGDFSKVVTGGGALPPGAEGRQQRAFAREYAGAFYEYLGSNGHRINAALYEGSNPAGGFAVPIEVAGQVVPLAPTDMGVRSIASVIPTASDIKIPRQTAISTATAKAEGTGDGSNTFTESEPTLDQFTLSAFMAGVLHQISWELAQDVPSFQSFALSDMLLAQQLYEENLYVNGTGSGQAQGLIGHTGAGVTGVLAGSDNYASELLAATFDVQSTLKTTYHQNAGWLMSRATATVIKKQQSQTNLFTPVWTRENGKDYLHGYPVTFSTAMPAIGASATPVLFGDFATGYVIGDRGGSGINVKILDQPKAIEGILQLLAYRRTDGRVRRSEAIQAITLHS